MQSGISGTENVPYASVCSIEELTPHLGTHMEVEGDFVRWWGVSNTCFIGSHQLFASAHFLSCITHDYLGIQGSAAPLERW